MSEMFVYEKINSAPLVADRPKCPQCKKPLRPWWDTHAEEKHADGRPGRVTYLVWNGKYDSYGAFCTLRCCERYANDVYRKLQAERRRI
jgi:hypothetical protein